MIILFGGGDGGGIYIHNGKVEIIPPFGPDVLDLLRTITLLLRSATHLGTAVAKEVGATAMRLTQEVMKAGVVVVGGSPKDFAFVDEDGGFFCGSTGKHLIPFPPRPHVLPPIPTPDLVGAGR